MRTSNARARAIGFAFTAAIAAAGCVSGSPPTLDPESLPPATTGTYFEVVFATSNQASVHTVSAPAGLELVPGPGHSLLFGYPREPGTFTLSVTATTGGPTMFQTPASTNREYTLTVAPGTADQSLTIAPGASSFTENVPLRIDLNPTVSGGEAPYRFTFFCVSRGETCDDPISPDFGAPDGTMLSDDGILEGTIAPKSGVSANRHDRRYQPIVCVVDATSAHACARLVINETAPPTSVPAPAT